MKTKDSSVNDALDAYGTGISRTGMATAIASGLVVAIAGDHEHGFAAAVGIFLAGFVFVLGAAVAAAGWSMRTASRRRIAYEVAYALIVSPRGRRRLAEFKDRLAYLSASRNAK